MARVNAHLASGEAELYLEIIRRLTLDISRECDRGFTDTFFHTQEARCDASPDDGLIILATRASRGIQNSATKKKQDRDMCDKAFVASGNGE